MNVHLRKTWAEIDLDHFRHNLLSIRHELKDSVKICVTLKANGYGHGAEELAKVAEESGADYIGLALLEEAIDLREAGIKTPLLIYGPVIEKEAMEAALDYDITFPIFQKEAAQLLRDLLEHRPETAKVHLAVDTGMGRIGVRSLEEALEILEILQDPQIEVEGIFTHFSDADNDEDQSYTNMQFQRFQTLLQSLDQAGYSFPLKHAANSAASNRFPETHLDMVREGIEIYGVMPSPGLEGKRNLKPVMRVFTQVTHVKTIAEGESVSYGRHFTADRPTRVATVSMGYADGLPRLLSSQAVLSFQGHRLPILGRVNMDQVMVDVTDQPDIQVGSILNVWGDPAQGETSVTEIADRTQTIPYEIMCGLSPRVPRIYKHKS